MKAFDSVENKVVIEISGGLGLPGIVSSFIKAKKVIITEKQPEISYLSRSIKLNGLTEEVKVEELDWLSNSQLQELLSKYSTIDYALLADCVSLDVYGEICLKALVNVLSKLKEKFSDIKFIICSKLRSNDGFPLFLKLLKERKLVKYDTLVLKEGECEVHCF